MARNSMSALGALAQGALQGYQLVKEQQRRERLDKLAEEEAGVRMANARTAGELSTEQLNTMRRNNEKQAQLEAADQRIRAAATVPVVEDYQPGKTEGEKEQVFRVGDKVFQSRASADTEARRLNSPVATARRQYEMAAEAGHPELAAQYRTQLLQTRSEAQSHLRESAMEAMRAGPWAVNKLYNDSVLDGRVEQLTQGPDGKLTVAYYQGGKRVSDPVTFKDQDQYIASHLSRFRTDPDSYLDNWARERQFNEQGRQFNEKMAWEREHGAAQLGVQRMSAGAQAAQYDRPQFLPLVTPAGETQVVAMGVDRRNGQPYAKSLGDPMPGLKNPPRPVDPLKEAQAAMWQRMAPASVPSLGGPGINIPDDWAEKMRGMQHGAR